MKWVAAVTYKNNPPKMFIMDELDELHQHIESGPCFYDVATIIITVDDEICKTCGDYSGCSRPADKGDSHDCV